MEARLRVPIAVAVVARIDDGPYMIRWLIADVVELEQVAGWLEVCASSVFEFAL